MGDVVTLTPRDGLLHFEGAALAKVEELFEQMLTALRRAKQTDTPGGIVLANEEIVRLQTEYARARERVEWLSEIFDAADRDRKALLHAVSDGQTAQFMYTNSSHDHVILLNVRRRGPKFASTDFRIFEHDRGRVRQSI